jgi:hypothetical protein
MDQLIDYTIGSKRKTMTVYNPHNYAVVVNEDGQSVPGRDKAVVFKSDAVALSVVNAGIVMLLETS